MELVVIGCSSGMPSGNVSTSSYLLEWGDKKYLLDAGDGTASAMDRLGIDINAIDNIFISHMHSDHSMGLPLLIQMMKLKQRTAPLSVYLPQEAEDGFKRLLYMVYLFPEKLGFDISFTGIEKDFEFHDDNISISFFQNSHLYANSDYIIKRTIPNRTQCFSMTVRSANRKFVYSADIGSIDDLDPIVENADLLLTEGMHLDLEALPALLTEKHVKKLMLTHLPDDFDLDKIRVIFEKAGFNNIGFAEEGMKVGI